MLPSCFHMPCAPLLKQAHLASTEPAFIKTLCIPQLRASCLCRRMLNRVVLEACAFISSNACRLLTRSMPCAPCLGRRRTRPALEAAHFFSNKNSLLTCSMPCAMCRRRTQPQQRPPHRQCAFPARVPACGAERATPLEPQKQGVCCAPAGPANGSG